MVLTLTPVCHDSEKNASRYYCVDMVEGGLLGHTRDTETLAFASDPKTTQTPHNKQRATHSTAP